jgi:hypothetical protein
MLHPEAAKSPVVQTRPCAPEAPVVYTCLCCLDVQVLRPLWCKHVQIQASVLYTVTRPYAGFHPPRWPLDQTVRGGEIIALYMVQDLLLRYRFSNNQ